MKKHSSSLPATAPKNSGDGKTDLDGWKHMGHYGSSYIYAKGDKRCLVDPKTGLSTFEYRITMSSTGPSVININGFSISRGEKREDSKSARL